MIRFHKPFKLAFFVLLCSVLVIGMTKLAAPDNIAECKSTPEPKLSPEAIARYNVKKEAIETVVANYFQKAENNGAFVGAGIAIVQGDSIIYADGVGKRKVNDNANVNGHTAFRLGSLSKGFAGVLSAAIEQDGLINWDDPINSYIPDFQLGSMGNQSPITIAHILSHSAGTPYHSYTDLVESGMDLLNIAPRFKNVQPISEPGKLYSYQNALFALSGKILEKATQCSFDKAINNRLFEPLGMVDATTNHKDFKTHGNIALPHRKTRYSWRSTRVTNKYDNAIAAGGINASPTDMAKWMRFLLGHNPEVLEFNAVSDAFEPKVEIKGKRKYYQRWDGHLSSHYGLGWRIHEFEDASTEQKQTMIHHGGSVNDYRNEIALFPDEDLGICVLFNSHTKLAKHVIPDLHKLIKEALNDTESKHTNSTVAVLSSKSNSNG